MLTSSLFFRIGRGTELDSSMISGELLPEILRLGEFRPEMTRTSSVSEIMDDWRVPEDDLPSLNIE